jgi:hypothetical protein
LPPAVAAGRLVEYVRPCVDVDRDRSGYRRAVRACFGENYAMPATIPILPAIDLERASEFHGGARVSSKTAALRTTSSWFTRATVDGTNTPGASLVE